MFLDQMGSMENAFLFVKLRVRAHHSWKVLVRRMSSEYVLDGALLMVMAR